MLIPILILIAVLFIVVERCRPGSELPLVCGWWRRIVLLNAAQAGIVVLAGLTWNRWLGSAATLFLHGHYALTKPVIMRGKVSRVLGLGGQIDHVSKSPRAFRIEGMGGPVTFGHFASIIPALAAAMEWLRGKSGGCLIWLHGPQPASSASRLTLERLIKRSVSHFILLNVPPLSKPATRWQDGLPVARPSASP